MGEDGKWVKSQNWIWQLINWIWQNFSGFRTQRSSRRTWQSVAAPVREGMSSLLHYSPTSSHYFCRSLPYPYHMSNTSTLKTFSWHMCSHGVPATVGRQTSGVGTKSFWQLLSWNDSLPHLVGLLLVKLFFPPSPSFPATPPWTALTQSSIPSLVWSIWSCCINNAVWPERFPPAAPHRARASWEPGGGGRTLPFWSSLSAFGACPRQQKMLTTRFTLYRRVSRQHK